MLWVSEHLFHNARPSRSHFSQKLKQPTYLCFFFTPQSHFSHVIYMYFEAIFRALRRLRAKKNHFFSKSKNNIENLAREALDIDPKCLWMKWVVPITHSEICINFPVGWKSRFYKQNPAYMLKIHFSSRILGLRNFVRNDF